jgi:hypothetical protein
LGVDGVLCRGFMGVSGMADMCAEERVVSVNPDNERSTKSKKHRSTW